MDFLYASVRLRIHVLAGYRAYCRHHYHALLSRFAHHLCDHLQDLCHFLCLVIPSVDSRMFIWSASTLPVISSFYHWIKSMHPMKIKLHVQGMNLNFVATSLSHYFIILLTMPISEHLPEKSLTWSIIRPLWAYLISSDTCKLPMYMIFLVSVHLLTLLVRLWNCMIMMQPKKSQFIVYSLIFIGCIVFIIQ